ncbi:DUF1707 SHOCT-like domain-containing protein [Salinactinospora qingdaonensis]|uniref:DUF1707 domain-containing protein n=1 Tax=Salinactinospora qingdaonensis TaxID=702744 RepID=A0ABP7EUL2_9ACTN
MDEEGQEQLRVSDADRDAVAERLGTALSEGRLDLAEYNERLETAMAAKTFADLAPLTKDLPVSLSETTTSHDSSEPLDLAAVGEANTPQRRWHDHIDQWRGLGGLAVILVGIWVVTSVVAGQMLAFWPVWPLGFMLIFTIASQVSGNRKR